VRTYLKVRGDQVEEAKKEVVREQPLAISVDGERFVTLLCSPMKLEALVVGYLWMEKVVAAVDEIERLEISEVDGAAAVTLTRPVTLPTERILTSGCGGGITFRIDHRLFPRLHSSRRVTTAALSERMKDLFAAAEHYQRSRGIHGAALTDGERLLVVAEDVGRHNAVDKVKGEALLAGLPTEDLILLSTGRISSEMLLKAARMGVPVVASRTSPTEMAICLAEQLNITVCGYVRPGSLDLYAGDALDIEEDLEGPLRASPANRVAPATAPSRASSRTTPSTSTGSGPARTGRAS
jgi:FdhD protein